MEIWVQDHCLRPGENCWAEHIERREDRTAPAWWIFIEPESGPAGWTDQPEHFGNIDACG